MTLKSVILLFVLISLILVILIEAKSHKHSNKDALYKDSQKVIKEINVAVPRRKGTKGTFNWIPGFSLANKLYRGN